MRPTEFLEEYYEKKKQDAQLPQQETLYTEEQVREAIEIAFNHWFRYSSCNVEEIIKSLKQPKKD